MSIASGFTKMKNYILTSSGYKLLSRWTSSQTVHMGDGTDDTDTVEYRFGAMKGVTSSLATDNDEFALSASAGKNLQDQCTQLNQSLTNINIYVGKDKKLHFVDSSGADTVLPFNSYDDGRIQGRNDVIGSPNSYGLYTKAQYDANKVTYKSGNYNTGLNGETWRSTSFNTGFSTIIALQINCWNDEGNGYFNAFKNVRISGGKVSLDFYAADYVDNYVQWLAIGK